MALTLLLPQHLKLGAGEGNRTLVVSLEGFCSTIELHPQFVAVPLNNILWWRGRDSNLRTQRGQIYSLLPLTTRPPLHGSPRLSNAQGCLSNHLDAASIGFT